MNDVFVGKNVSLSYRETKVVELSGEVVADTPEGITIRHTYRKGKRLEFIPRDKLQSLFLDEEKRSRKPSPSKVDKSVDEESGLPFQKPAIEKKVEEEPVVEEEDSDIDETLSEGEDFDDGDEFEDDDEFE
jgi:hypothetical protein